MKIQANNRLAKVEAAMDALQAKALNSIANIFGDSAMVPGGNIGTIKSLEDDEEVPGVTASLNTTEVYMSAAMLARVATVLKHLGNDNLELGFSVVGGKLFLSIADTGDL